MLIEVTEGSRAAGLKPSKPDFMARLQNAVNILLPHKIREAVSNQGDLN